MELLHLHRSSLRSRALPSPARPATQRRHDFRGKRLRTRIRRCAPGLDGAQHAARFHAGHGSGCRVHREFHVCARYAARCAGASRQTRPTLFAVVRSDAKRGISPSDRQLSGLNIRAEAKERDSQTNPAHTPMRSLHCFPRHSTSSKIVRKPPFRLANPPQTRQ